MLDAPVLKGFFCLSMIKNSINIYSSLKLNKFQTMENWWWWWRRRW